MKRKLKSLIIATTLFICAACNEISSPLSLNEEKVKKISIGMSTAQVIDIMGKPDSIRITNALGLDVTTYVYTSGKDKLDVVFVFNKATIVDMTSD